MRINCPKCGQAFDVPESLSGKKAKCSACAAVFAVPAPLSVAPVAQRCAECGAELDAGTVLCLKCGYNLETGVKAQTAAAETEAAPQAMEDEEEDKPPSWDDKVVAVFEAWMPGALKPGVLAFAVVLILGAFTLMWLTLYMMQQGVGMIALMSAGLGVIVYAQGLAWLIVGEYQLLIEAMSDFDLYRWTVFLALLCPPYAIVFGLAGQYV